MKTKQAIAIIIEGWKRNIVGNRQVPPETDRDPRSPDQPTPHEQFMASLTPDQRANMTYLASLEKSLPALADRLGDVELPLQG